MLVGFWLFESQLIHVVAITFTALILTELLMVALTIRTWHGLMVVGEVVSVGIYVGSLALLSQYFGMHMYWYIHIYILWWFFSYCVERFI